MAYSVVIGGANIDIVGYPINNRLIRHDSNPGVIKTSSGGVGRNIAENIARLGEKIVFLGVVGKDLFGQQIIQESQNAGINMDHMLITKDETTSTYLCVLDEKRDMDVAVCHMGITDRINEEYLETKDTIIENSNLIIIDGNFKEKILSYILNKYENKKILYDPVSSTKAMYAKNIIGKFYAIKPNRIEAETLTGIKISNKKDFCKVGQYFLKKGVKEIFITNGEKGVYYNNGINEGFYCPEIIEMKNATGAGDAFAAGLAYGILKELNIRDKVKFASKCASIALMSENTINSQLSATNQL